MYLFDNMYEVASKMDNEGGLAYFLIHWGYEPDMLDPTAENAQKFNDLVRAVVPFLEEIEALVVQYME